MDWLATSFGRKDIARLKESRELPTRGLGSRNQGQRRTLYTHHDMVPTSGKRVSAEPTNAHPQSA